MPIHSKVRRTIALTAAAGAALFLFLLFQAPPTLGKNELIAYGTLLALSGMSMMLYLRLADGGSTSSLDFVPELAALLLVGPSGAVIVTVLSEVVAGFILHRKKPLYKRIFNAAQLTVAAGAAGVTYLAFGGSWSVNPSDAQFSYFLTNIPIFFVAVAAYFAVNTTTVAYIVSVAEREPFRAIWQSLTGGLIFFDIAMSPLAVLVAYILLLNLNRPWIVLLAIIPLIGLRYTYGVNYELQQLNTDLLRLMVKTIEAQDPYTSGHSIRVSESARLICQELGVRGRDAAVIEKAALLHDIGKIDLAYNDILRQAGPLTPEQRQLIRAHPERGVEIIRSIRSIRPEVLECVMHHHERWDGNGYPEGLSGAEIPRGARIIMICDTVDAMTTARPYRAALPAEVVREELLKHRGSQFDPTIVDVVVTTGLLDKLVRNSTAASAHEPTSEAISTAAAAQTS